MLSEPQLQVLGFLAYTGTSMSDRSLNIFCTKFGLDDLKVRAVLRELFFNNLLEHNSKLIKYNTLPVLTWLVENKPDWLTIYKSIDIQGQQVWENMECMKFLNALYTNAPTFLRKDISYNFEPLLTYLCPLISNSLFRAEMLRMPITSFKQYIQVLIHWLLENDINEGEALLQVWNNKEDFKTIADEEWALTLLYVYFANGDIPENIVMPNTWHKSIVEGTQNLISNQYGNASACFKEALKFQSMDMYFPDPLSNYLYSLSLILDGNSENRMKMYNISDQRTNSKNNSWLPLKILSTYFKDSKHIVDDVSLKTFCEYAENSHKQGLKMLALVLSHAMRRNFGGFKNGEIFTNLWILKNECSFLKNLGSQNTSIISRVQSTSSTSNNNVFNTGNTTNTNNVRIRPSVTSIPISHPQKPQSASKPFTTGAQGSTCEEKYNASPVNVESSLVYVMKEDHRLYPYRRICKGSDQRCQFQQIDTLDYMKGRIGTKNVSDIDRQMWGIWKSSGYGFPIERVMPLLTNTEKLYTFISEEFATAKAVYFTPYFEVNVKEEVIEIISNIELSDVPRTGLAICKVAKGLVYYSILSNETKSSIIQALSRKQYPLAFEEQLHHFFAQLRNNNIEVRGDSYASGLSPKTLKGSTKLEIQVSAKNNTKNIRYITVIAKPLEGYSFNMYAGEGLEVFPTRIGKQRCLILRDLYKERSNKNEMLDFLRKTGCDMNPVGKNMRSYALDITQMLSLVQFAADNSDKYSLSWQCPKLNVKELSPADINMKVNHKEDWLELEGNVSVSEDSMINIRDFFENIMGQEGRYIQIDENNYVMLEEKLRNELKQLSSAFNDNGHKLKASKLAATLVADTLSEYTDNTRLQLLDDNRERMKEAMKLDFVVPSMLNAELRPYQNVGFQWMSRLAHWGAGACLADDMGLGKTLQSISFMLDRSKEGPSLVVAPASVIKNWDNEINRFAPTLHTKILASSKRNDTIEKLKDGDILIVTYGLLISSIEQLKEKQWCVICLDEAHTIKNKSTKTSSAVMELQSLYKLALTGTPIQNNLSELWNIFQFTNPGLLGSYEQFKKKFVYPIMNSQNMERQELLKKIIAPFMMRRTKSEVAKELPSKNEETLLVNLSEDEKDAYEYIRSQAQKKATEAKDEKGNKGNIDILSEITKLRLAACSITLQKSNWYGQSSKIRAFESLLKMIFEAEKSPQILVFSQFTSFLKMIGDTLKDMDVNYLYLDGTIPIKQRAKLVDDFQNGKAPLFLISLQAGGVGLNLTAANHVILLDPWWNPAIEQQAIDRAYRIGQQRDVTIHHLISCNTIEEKIVRLQKTKNDMASALLSGQELGNAITYEEMRELITT